MSDNLNVPCDVRQVKFRLLQFMSAIVIISFLIAERHLLGSRWWVPVLGLMFFGVSVALPLLLYLREAGRQQASS